jgi:hypothetical protein
VAFTGLILGFIVAAMHSPFFFHIILRFCFYFEGDMPMRYVDFLKYATNRRILENDGGQWRFRHKILQDYFARLETEGENRTNSDIAAYITK